VVRHWADKEQATEQAKGNKTRALFPCRLQPSAADGLRQAVRPDSWMRRRCTFVLGGHIKEACRPFPGHPRPPRVPSLARRSNAVQAPPADLLGTKLPDRFFLLGLLRLLGSRDFHGTFIFRRREEFSVSPDCSFVDTKLFRDGAVGFATLDPERHILMALGWGKVGQT
jgi:hypothetical protein